jgi:hypothetical protein
MGVTEVAAASVAVSNSNALLSAISATQSPNKGLVKRFSELAQKRATLYKDNKQGCHCSFYCYDLISKDSRQIRRKYDADSRKRIGGKLRPSLGSAGFRVVARLLDCIQTVLKE